MHIMRTLLLIYTKTIISSYDDKMILFVLFSTPLDPPFMTKFVQKLEKNVVQEKTKIKTKNINNNKNLNTILTAELRPATFKYLRIS